MALPPHKSLFLGVETTRGTLPNQGNGGTKAERVGTVLSEENMAIADWMLRAYIRLPLQYPDSAEVELLAQEASKAQQLQYLGPNIGICRKIAKAVVAFSNDSSRALAYYMMMGE